MTLAPAGVVVLASLTFPIQYGVSGFLTAGASAKAVGPTAAGVQQSARTTNDAIFTADQARRGEALYQQHCASCHGSTLAGAEAAPALAGPAFSASWNAAPIADLFERIRISMPQDNPGSLSRQQNADVIAYILGFNKAPAGQTELPADVEALKSIKIAPAN